MCSGEATSNKQNNIDLTKKCFKISKAVVFYKDIAWLVISE